MAEKNRVFESEVISLPPIRAVLGDIPSPDPVRRSAVKAAARRDDLHDAVIRLIRYFKEDRKPHLLT